MLRLAYSAGPGFCSTNWGRMAGKAVGTFAPPCSPLRPKKTFQLTLKSLQNCRPVAPEVAGSSPVAPAMISIG